MSKLIVDIISHMSCNKDMDNETHAAGYHFITYGVRK